MNPLFPYQVKVSLELENPTHAEIIQQSLLPDMGRKDEKRSQVSIKRNKNVLSVEIYAQDKVALRAATNAHLKLIQLSNQILHQRK